MDINLIIIFFLSVSNIMFIVFYLLAQSKLDDLRADYMTMKTLWVKYNTTNTLKELD